MTIPGHLLFLGDLDGDGFFPDDAAVDLFGLLTDAYMTLIVNDQPGILALLDVASAARDQLLQSWIQAGELFQLTTAIVVSPETSGVDAEGCSRRQFCAGIRLKHRSDARVCLRSDFKNEEPLRSRPRDCRMVRRHRGKPRCSAR